MTPAPPAAESRKTQQSLSSQKAKRRGDLIGKIAASHHVAALLVVLAIDTRVRTMDTACMRDVEDAVPYAKDAVLL